MKCPICRRVPDPDYRPFCSQRCADVDLGRWLTGSYRVPTDEAPGQDTDLPAPGNDPDTGERTR